MQSPTKKQRQDVRRRRRRKSRGVFIFSTREETGSGTVALEKERKEKVP